MNIKPDCYLCIYTQAFKLTKKISLDEIKASEILRESAKTLSKYSLAFTPPQIASDIYSLIEKKTNVKDPFENEKKEAIKEALKFKPILKEKLKSSKDKLFDAVKIAVAGNVIDLGVNSSYDLEEEIKDIFNLEFFINHYNEFKKKVLKAKTICYLADNAGENIFDEILIEVIKEFNKNVKIYYIVRGKPIINDVTINDLKGLDIFNLAEVVDSGVDTPGFFLKRANEKSKEIFYNSDLVISKGMGNFEVLFEECSREVFYIFKVKCDVVASKVEAKKGDYILLKGNK